MSRSRSTPAACATRPARDTNQPVAPLPLAKRRWLLVLAILLEAAWLAALVVLSLR
jgi:hypothetical protein